MNRHLTVAQCDTSYVRLGDLLRTRWWMLICCLIWVGCEVEKDYVAEVVYVPDGDGFWRTPWPSDTRRTSTGNLDLSDFPGADVGLLATYASLFAEQVDGFSTMPVWVASFSTLPDDISLPAPGETLDSRSPIQLVGLGAHCGQRRPLEVLIHRGADPYLPNLAVQAALVPGAPLPVGSTWAFILTDDFAGGTRPDDVFREARRSDPSLAPLNRCPILPQNIAVASVFTTQNPVEVLQTLRDHAAEQPASKVDSWTVLEEHSVAGAYRSWRGSVDMPIYQEGSAPYLTQGGFVYDSTGQPLIQGFEAVEFVISMPDGIERPPIVIWQSGARADLTGWIDAPLASALRDGGFAVAKFLPQFHGSRNVQGGDADFHTYNYLNPKAGRSVLLQEAVDVTTFVSVLQHSLPIDAGQPMGLIGHSQGAEVGAMLAAVEPRIDTFVLHGVGTYLSETIVHRTDPFDVSEVLGDMFGITEISRFHPMIQLVQVGADVVDPGNYLGTWSERAANAFIVGGYHDQDVYWVSINTLVIGADATVTAPVGWDVDPYDVWDVVTSELPIQGNHTNAMGSEHTVAAYLDKDGDHYTLYEDHSLHPVAVGFFTSALSGVPVLSP